MRIRHVMPPYILQSFQQLALTKKKGGTGWVSTLVRYQCPIMSEGDGNPENKDLVSQITADPNAIADLSRALILSSLEESLAARSNNGAGSSRDARSQGEHNRLVAKGVVLWTLSMHRDLYLITRLLTPPSKIKHTVRVWAMQPHHSWAMQLHHSWAMQLSIIRGMQPHISWATITRQCSPNLW